MVERKLCAIVGSIPSRVIPHALKMIVMVALIGVQGCGVSIATDLWCQDKWTNSTGNLPRKRRDITGKLLKTA